MKSPRRLYVLALALAFATLAPAVAAPDIIVYVGVQCGIAAAQATRSGATVQSVDLPPLQTKLRAQHQVIDFLPGQPEKCERLNGPPEF
jgi:hypothetical protein